MLKMNQYSYASLLPINTFLENTMIWHRRSGYQQTAIVWYVFPPKCFAWKLLTQAEFEEHERSLADVPKTTCIKSATISALLHFALHRCQLRLSLPNCSMALDHTFFPVSALFRFGEKHEQGSTVFGPNSLLSRPWPLHHTRSFLHQHMHFLRIKSSVHPSICIRLSAPIRLHSFVCTHLYEPACVHPSVFTHGGKKQNRRGSDVQFFEARYGCSSALVGHFPPLFTHFVTPSPTACFAVELMLLGLQRALSK